MSAAVVVCLLLLPILLHPFTRADGASESKALFCYFADSTFCSTSSAKCFLNDFNPGLCNALVYVLITVGEDDEVDFGLSVPGKLNELTRLRVRRPGLKVLVYCGGEASVFSRVAGSAEKRQTFIASLVQFLKTYKLDGVEIAWEYPAANDKEIFPVLLKELREVLEPYSFTLVTRLSARKSRVDVGYNIPKIFKAVHYVSLDADRYLIEGSKANTTHHNTPFQSENELNVEVGVNYVLEKGGPPERILLGFSSLGFLYLMDEPVPEGSYLGVPAKRERELTNNEVCRELTTTEGWTQYWDADASVPYAVKDNRFMTYNDWRALTVKLNFLDDKGLGGAAMWSVGTDDVKGLCDQVKFPLTSQISSFLIPFEEVHEFNSTVILEEFRR